MSVDVVTFGCRLNIYESEVLRQRAEKAGEKGDVEAVGEEVQPAPPQREGRGEADGAAETGADLSSFRRGLVPAGARFPPRRPGCAARGALGPVRIRRRHGLLNGRRPRFLTRRKTGRLAELPVIVSGERLTD